MQTLAKSSTEARRRLPSGLLFHNFIPVLEELVISRVNVEFKPALLGYYAAFMGYS